MGAVRRACLVPIIALAGACGAQDFPFDSVDAGAEAGAEGGADAATSKTECSHDFDCPLRSQQCASGQCVACVTNTDCATQAGHRFCDPMLHQCVECELDVNCPGGFCEPTTHRCVLSCEDAGGCPDYYTCTRTGVCVDCTKPEDCVGARTGPWCAVAVGQCVQCLASDQCSPDKPLCNTATARCVECLSDHDCSSGEACEPQSHSCVDVRGSGFYDGGQNQFSDSGVSGPFDGGADSGFR